MDSLIHRIDTEFRSFDAAKTTTPQRSGFNYHSPTGLVEWMPLHHVGNEVVIKIVGYHPTSPKQFGLPTIVSTMSSYDTRTGHLKAIVDATFLTSMRTGAASAVASRLLANPESRILGIVGCGAQAVTQIHALSRVFDLNEIMVFDTDSTASADLQHRTESILPDGIQFTLASLRDISARSDIVCTATSVEAGDGPVLPLEKTKSWLHVNAVGSDFPGKTELPFSFLSNSFVVPDFVLQAKTEGECQQLDPSQFETTITDVAKSPAQFALMRNKTTVFDSTGWALEDWVTLELAVELATKLGLGQEIEIECIPHDPRNPYEFLPALTEKIS